MSSKELSLWIAYYNLHPFGVERDNLHAGMIASMVGNANLAKGKAPFSPTDFMMQSDKERRIKETQQTIAYLRAHAKPKQEK